MIDLGFDKLALISAVALIVIGPEKLPRVARTAGHLLGKARRYVADVRAEVNRSIELDELKKMKTQFEDAANSVQSEVHKAASSFESEWQGVTAGLDGSGVDPTNSADASTDPWQPPPPVYRHPKKNWRLKRGATPQWYKQRQGVRTKALSGAARVARYRPRPASASRGAGGE